MESMNRIRPILSLIFLCVPFIAAAHPLDHWHQRHVVPNGVYPSAMVHGDGLLVAVGGNGWIVTSPDGTNWTTQISGTAQALGGVAYGNGVFISVGHSGTVLSSPDGTKWTPRSSGTTANLLAVKHGNGVFVASGERGVILNSPDGVTWTPHNPGIVYYSDDLAYGNGLFVLAVGRGTNLISIDGTNWMPGDNGSSQNLWTLGFGNRQFLAIDVQRRVLTSTDATNWTARGTITLIRPPETAYGNGIYLVVGSGNPEYSPDGNQWNQSTASLCNCPARAATFANGYFYVVADNAIWQSDPVVQVEFSGLGILTVAGPTNRTYQIESTEDLAAPSGWQSTANITLSASPQSWTDPRPPTGQQFYRAQLLP